MEVELDRPLPALEKAQSPGGRPYRRANVFVRLHGEPLGWVDVPLGSREGLTPAELATTVWPDVMDRARAHLERDGEEAPALLPPDGLQMAGEPTCIRERRAFLETAPRLSVLIPSRERPERLRRCLDSLLVLRVSDGPCDVGNSGQCAGDRRDPRLGRGLLGACGHPIRAGGRAGKRKCAQLRHAGRRH